MLERLRNALGRRGNPVNDGKAYGGDAGAGPNADNTAVNTTILVNGKAVTERDLDPETLEKFKNAVWKLEDICKGGEGGEPVVVPGRPDAVVHYSTTFSGKKAVEKDLDPETREILQNAMKRLVGHGEKTGGPIEIEYHRTTINGKEVAEKDLDPGTREILQNAMKRLESHGGYGIEQHDTGVAGKAVRDDRKVPCIYCGKAVGATATKCPACGMSLRR